MAQIKCPECGIEISSVAKTCPNCGFPIDEKTDGEIGNISSPSRRQDNYTTNDGKKKQESGYNGENKTVKCPNRLCGKEVSDKFDYCPFCHTLLIKPTKTAEDIINERKRKEDDLRDAIRKQYNIDGDISEEQYGQLREIYLKEYGNRNDANKKESPSGQRNGSVGWVIGIVVALIIFLIIFFAAGGGHSKTYNEYMSRIKTREASINRATSLFDMAKLNERILPLGALDDLTDGDEKRAVRLAHDEVWDLFETKCRQLAIGYYLLTSENGQKYVVELSEESGNDGNQAYVYIDNCLYSKGYWHLSDGPAIRINHNPINEEYRNNRDLEINLSIKYSSWSGDIDNVRMITIFPDKNERARIKKIEIDYTGVINGSLKKMDNVSTRQFSKNTYTPNNIKPLISTMEMWRKVCLNNDLENLRKYFTDNVEWKNEQYSREVLLEHMEKRLYGINSVFSSYYWISLQKDKDIVVIERYPYDFTFSKTPSGWKIFKVNM